MSLICPDLVEEGAIVNFPSSLNSPKAIFLTGAKIGTQMFYGHGAGGDATGAVVVSDLIEIACDFAAGQLRAKRISGFAGGEELEELAVELELIAKRDSTEAGKLEQQVAKVLEDEAGESH